MATPPGVLDAYMSNVVRGPPVTTMKYAARIDEKMSESAAGRARKELEANRREAELTRKLEMKDARFQREKAVEATDAVVEGEGSIPKPSILKPSHPDEFVISTPTKDFEDTPTTPEGREASRPGDEEMRESFEFMGRD